MATSARLEELRQKFNENPRRYFAPLANEHRKLGDLDQAIALCRSHLPQQPQHVSGHIVLAQALFEAGNTPDARRTFEVALDLDPENLIALRYLGDIARAQGEHAAARQWYERVLDADPRNDEIARLIRDIEEGAPAPEAAPTAPVATEAVETPSSEQEEAAPSAEPNETHAQAATPEQREAEPVEDLATAWQHEVEALEAPAQSKAADAIFAELPVEEPQLELPEPESSDQQPQPSYAEAEQSQEQQEPVAEMAPPVEEPEVAQASTSSEPNESWEPDADFVSSVPPVQSSAPAAPTPFAEIDYSVFEAVADEEPVASPPSEQSFAEEPVAHYEHPSAPYEEPVTQQEEPVAQYEEPAAQYQQPAAHYEEPVEHFEQPAAHYEEPVAHYEEPVARYDEPVASVDQSVAADAPVADDWFATPSTREIETFSPDTVGESAFDLDAAFQQVLPNNSEAAEQEIEPLEVPQGSLQPYDDPAPTPTVSEETEDRTAGLETASLTSGDGVDDAFAELDRLTAGLETESELPDEQYLASATTEEMETPQHVDALIGRTPESGVPSVEEAPAAFVTETMAELYLQQGFREEALAVYRQLLEQSPGDEVLARRVASLEGQDTAPALAESEDPWSARVESAPHARSDALGQSVRSFLGIFARRRAPMRRRQPAKEQPEVVVAQAESALGALFGAAEGSDDASAAVLAGAFTAPNGDATAIPGRPTRAAAEELKLGDVFSNPRRSGSHAATFDEFFSSGSAEQPAQSPLDEEGSDMVQFTAWLEGLKKR